MLHAPLAILMHASSFPGAGLVFATCEWFHGLPFEIRNVWRNHGFPLHLRCIYVLTRYIGLLGQVSHLAAFDYLSKTTSASRSVCHTFWFSQAAMGAFGVGMLQILLSRRVYALWNGDRRIGLFLFLLFVLHLVLFVVFWGITMEDTEYQDSNCFMTDHLPKEAIYLCGTVVLTQLCIWTLAFAKHVTLARGLQGSGGGKIIQLVTQICRENFLITLFACAIPFVVIIDWIRSQLAEQVVTAIYLAPPLFLAIVTSATCRMIASMHKMSRKILQEDVWSGGDEGLVLTSICVD